MRGPPTLELMYDDDDEAEDGGRELRGEDVMHPLKVSLEELYNGTSKKLSLSRNVICFKCKGSLDSSSCGHAHLFLNSPTSPKVETTMALQLHKYVGLVQLMRMCSELEKAKEAETILKELEKAKEAETSRTTEAEALIQQVKQEVEKTNAAETETTEVEAMIIQLKQELEAAKAAETKIAEAETFVKKLKELEFVRGIYIYSNSSTVFNGARVRECERELLYPDACGGGGWGWISQGAANYGRGHGTRESCVLHTVRLSYDTLVDFWSALGDKTRRSLLRMKEEDFIERLMYRLFLLHPAGVPEWLVSIPPIIGGHGAWAAYPNSQHETTKEFIAKLDLKTSQKVLGGGCGIGGGDFYMPDNFGVMACNVGLKEICHKESDCQDGGIAYG
ncbi:hypothetical protein IFM89_023935 [Coptis chinensis]|uniref:Uncharacterized protein n=1 Tax=Coptis chinensis TaxID=261450 RepID=A0A835I4Z2_9MAGN|nr:hypothetical protein IFM89_023935 [Coptis chinensis]